MNSTNSVKNHSLIVEIGFEVLLFHVEIRAIGLFVKIGNSFFIIDHNLRKIKRNLPQHRLHLFNSLSRSKRFRNLHLKISNFNSFNHFLNPEITTRPSNIHQPHTHRMANHMFYILVIDHAHKLVGTNLHQQRHTKVVAQHNQLLISVRRDVVRDHQPIAIEEVEKHFVSDSTLLVEDIVQGDLLLCGQLGE